MQIDGFRVWGVWLSRLQTRTSVVAALYMRNFECGIATGYMYVTRRSRATVGDEALEYFRLAWGGCEKR